MAKVSASNVAERQPTAKKGAANVTGATGGALAVLFLKEWDAKAKQLAEEQMSLKERLMSLVKLTHEDHLAFRAAITERRETITKAAQLVTQTLNVYFENQPGSQYVYTQCSEWNTMSKAVELGWMPNPALPWAQIKTAAVDRVRNAEARAALSQDEQKLLAATETDPKLSVEKKAEVLQAAGITAKLEGIMAKLGGPGRKRTGSPTAPAPTQATAGPAGTPAAQAPTVEVQDQGIVATQRKQIIDMLRNQSVDVITGVAAWLQSYMNSEEFKAREEKAKQIKRELEQKSKDAANMAKGTTVAKKGAIGDEVKEEKEEKAEARGTRRTPAKTRGRKASK